MVVTPPQESVRAGLPPIFFCAPQPTRLSRKSGPCNTGLDHSLWDLCGSIAAGILMIGGRGSINYSQRWCISPQDDAWRTLSERGVRLETFRPGLWNVFRTKDAEYEASNDLWEALPRGKAANSRAPRPVPGAIGCAVHERNGGLYSNGGADPRPNDPASG